MARFDWKISCQQDEILCDETQRQRRCQQDNTQRGIATPNNPTRLRHGVARAVSRWSVRGDRVRGARKKLVEQAVVKKAPVERVVEKEVIQEVIRCFQDLSSIHA